MTKDITEFIHTNYSNYESIIKRELFTNDNPPDGFYESFILTILPRLKKIRNKEEFYPIVKVQLLNFFKENELPSKEKIKQLSDTLYSHFVELNRDIRSERLNRLHSGIGLFLIVINILIFVILEILYSDEGFSLGIISLIFGVTVWFLPSISGYFAYRKNKLSYFGTGHYLWMIFNLGLICLLIRALISYL
jgi:hypothetical protein